VIGHVDMNQFDAPGIPLRPEGEDRYGIKDFRFPMFDPPGLDDQTFQHSIKHSPGEHVAEGRELRAGFRVDGYRGSCEGSMDLRVQVHVVEPLCQGGERYSLLDGLGHRSFPFSRRLI
jgi:hypothetical protein